MSIKCLLYKSLSCFIFLLLLKILKVNNDKKILLTIASCTQRPLQETKKSTFSDFLCVCFVFLITLLFFRGFLIKHKSCNTKIKQNSILRSILLESKF